MDEYSDERSRSEPSALRRWGPAMMVVAMLAFYLYVSRAAPPPPGWGDDFAQAVAQAAANDSRIVVEFYSEGCPPCAAMSRHVLGDTAVREALMDSVPVRIDAWRDERLARRLGVLGTPTYAVLSPDGKVFARAEGYRSVEQFVTFLTQGLSPTAPEVYSVGPLRRDVP